MPADDEGVDVSSGVLLCGVVLAVAADVAGSTTEASNTNSKQENTYNIIKGNNCNEAHIEVRTTETVSVAESLQNRRYTQLHIPNFKYLGLVSPTLDKG